MRLQGTFPHTLPQRRAGRNAAGTHGALASAALPARAAAIGLVAVVLGTVGAVAAEAVARMVVGDGSGRSARSILQRRLFQELRMASGDRGRQAVGSGGHVSRKRRDAGLLHAAVGCVAVVCRTIGAVAFGAPGEMG